MPNHVDIVVNRLPTYPRISVLQRPEFITLLCVRLVLKRVGVDGIESEAVVGSQLPDRLGIGRNIPRNVQRNGSARPVQRVKQADVLDFLFQRARLSPTRKPAKARTARTQRPTRNGNLKSNQFLNNRFGLRHGVGPVREFPLVSRQCPLVMVVYLMRVELHIDAG